MKKKIFSVLIIDDDTDRSIILKQLMVPLGFSIHQGFNGAEGIRKAEEEIPDLILLDVLLPDIHGFDVLLKLKSQPKTCNSFVVMISSNLITSLDLSRGLENGADGYMTFPMTNREFGARLSAFVKHKQAIDNLRESELRLQTLLNSSPNGIMMRDANGMILYCNETACEIFNKTAEELINADLGIPTSLTNETILEIPSKDGVRTIEIRQVDSPVANPDISVLYLHDITVNRLTEKKLNNLIDTLLSKEQHQDKLFSIIAHDLKGPFGTLLNFSQILSSQLDILRKDEIKKHLGLIASSSQKIFTLLINLLDWSRISAGSWKYSPEPVAVTDVITDVFSLYKDMADQKNIALFNSVEKETIMLSDSNILHTVIRNLVGNSIRFTLQGGQIRITCTENSHDFCLSVADNGIGISAEKLEKLFKKNQLGEKEHPESGTGLGMLICKELVEMAGGRIEVDSELNFGTKVNCYFPRSGEAP
jgi:signal transduction histidine kinase/ActR/RegA family two-component response regulator